MDPLVIVVTGTNRGVGRGIVHLLAQQSLTRPLTIYATSRSGGDTDIEVKPPNKIQYRKIDITDPSSIQTFLQTTLKEVPAIDILINNAAVANDHRETPFYAEETIRTNYAGTRNMCEAFLAAGVMSRKPYTRIVNVTSGMNALSTYGAALQSRFRSVHSTADIDALATSYLDAMKLGPEVQEQAGWGTGARSYKVSKALNMAMTILLAKQHGDVALNNACPGWTDTEMGRSAGSAMTPPKTAEEGARVPVRLAIGDLTEAGDADGGLGKVLEDGAERVSGRFFENENIMSKGWGRSKLWVET